MSDADDSFSRWCETALAVAATTKRLEKSAHLERYLREVSDQTLPVAARFFSGLVFPRHDMRTTQVGGATVVAALRDISGLSEESAREIYVAHGDLGDFAGAVLAGQPASGVPLLEVAAWAEELARAGGVTSRRDLVRGWLTRLGEDEARYFVKLIAGEMRMGLKEAQVEEALARAFGRPLEDVRRANLLRGDIGEVAVLSRHEALEQAALALFHPIGFMLAQPLATAEEICAALPAPFAVEHKYDGIRVQAHVRADRVALYSRTLDEITHGYPEVVERLALLGAAAGAGIVLDGELLAVDPQLPDRALPFALLQKRLGRKRPSAAVQRDIPAAFIAYDIIAADGTLVVDETYTARRERLLALPWPGPGSGHSAAGAWVAPSRLATTAEEVETSFAQARAAGNEGVVLKDPESRYTPGRRGRTWIKFKKALATLDVVVTGVERGHGRRRHVLSDYTFAVRASEDDPTLLNVGKAYNGLTDAEIAEMTTRFEALTVARFGRFHQVRPEVVLEVTFDIVQASRRHKAGYALRFPRIVRIRSDKGPGDIDTLARVRELAGEPAE